jgi:hypothetical protein
MPSRCFPFALFPSPFSLFPVVFTVLIALGAAAPAAAQRASLSGVIVDQSGAVLPGVTITLVNGHQGLKRQTVTNELGRFVLALLPPGPATLTATLSGFAPHEISNVFLNVGDNVSLVITLDLAKLGESVTVVAESVPVMPDTVPGPSIAIAPALPKPPSPQETSLPWHLRDRGTGVPSSMFATYIRRGEFIIYPFFEYYRDHDLEYNPSELGFQGDQDYRGRYRARENLFFFGYGLTDDLAVEFEAAMIRATLEKAPDDLSTVPARIEESGLADIEAQIRWRWLRENERRPEFFSYGEVVFPHSTDKVLIGTPDWELKFGTGLIRGFMWGTITARAAVEYAKASTSEFDVGEYAIEYMKQVSPSWRLYAGLEGTQDELSFISEAQWHVTRYVAIKLNNGVGLTSKAVDWEPEVGVMFTIPTRGAGARAASAERALTRPHLRGDRPRQPRRD